ncbi:uncharacterized protein LOC126267775 [Schistocerca gregaria]|uniref:uncharacterized protein LOC126267775 n=1 Tax=Schistocerca gregaria TaxID=7010 RepID=UPI00211DFBA0|nr:uncharacterized protein LOC126267775 [Schistocerca gregaria]
MEPVTEAKRKALLAYKRNPNERTRDDLRKAKNRAQQTPRRCANNYWVNLCAGIQKAADSGDDTAMYDGIKKAVGPTVRKTAPLKPKTGEVIANEGKQMKRWVERYLELCAAENEVSKDACDAIQQMPVLEQLDAMPTMEELSRETDSLANGKNPGEDGIAAEVIKYNKSVLKHLHSLITISWEEGYVPMSMQNSRIVTLYKQNGNRSDWNTYRGISLIRVARKAYARVILMRLQTLASRIYPESQCGFRPGPSTVDMIFSLRQLQEKCREQQRPLYIAFMDLVKAFDLVSRNGLFKLL